MDKVPEITIECLPSLEFPDGIGVSLYSDGHLDHFLDDERLNGLQLKLSLLDPRALLDRLDRIRVGAPAAIAGSCRKDGFLTRKWVSIVAATTRATSAAAGPASRSPRPPGGAERFRFLEDGVGTMTAGKVRYAHSFPKCRPSS